MADITIKGGNTLKVITTTDNIWLPNPKFGGFKVDLEEIDGESTGRNQTGTMFRDVVRGGANAVRKLHIEFPPLTSSELSSTLQAIASSSFSLSYPDPYTGADRTATFYCGTKTSPIYSTSYNQTTLWSGLSVSLVEV